jgi:hypothetical protein
MTTDVSFGAYRPCRTCGAPIVDPFPAEWTIDLIREGPRRGPVRSFCTPHSEQCDALTPEYTDDTGICVRLPGRYVTSIDISPPPVPSGPLGIGRQQVIRQTSDPETPVSEGYLYYSSADTVDWTGWVPLGATVDGYRRIAPGIDAIPVTGPERPVEWLNGLWPVHLDPEDGDVTE